MAIRSAEVKAHVTLDVKAEAESIYAHLGMSLGDAINAFLVKSVDVGGMPFDMRVEPRHAYDTSAVLPADPRWGSSLLPASIDDEEDGAYDHLVRQLC